MEVIKYRCFYNNEMHNVASIDFNSGRINLNGADIINFEDGKLMQFTGMLDRNNKEIYERRYNINTTIKR